MFLGDRGQPSTFNNIRMNYDIIIDNEKMTIQKLSQKIGFYSIESLGTIKNTEIVYDTDRKLLTGAGLILRKKIMPQRTYFSLVRVSSINSLKIREKKSFLGECDVNDQPSDFPRQIADVINGIFKNLFTINMIDIVKRCTPYIKIDIEGHLYKIHSGTGYEAEMCFETLKIKDFRTGNKVVKRNFTIEMDTNPDYENERKHIIECVDRYCKEMLFVNRNRFEIAEVAVHAKDADDEDGKPNKDKKQKKSRKELKQEQKAQQEQNSQGK